MRLFKDNPYVMDSRPVMSLWVGKPESVLQPKLDELVSMGVLKRWGTDPGAVYAYTRDEGLRRMLDERWDAIAKRANERRSQIAYGGPRQTRKSWSTEEG